MSTEAPDHYATLGLDRRCTLAQIRSAYRLLAKRYHPDVNAGSAEAVALSQMLNVAHETLSDPARRRAYDRELSAAAPAAPALAAKTERNIAQDVRLRIEDFIRGTTLDVRVNDPANPEGPETYQLTVPPETAVGARFRLPRAEPFAGGFVILRLRALPGFHSVGTGYTYHSGDKADGWIVRVKSGGEVIRVKGSNPQMEQLEHDKAAFEAMLKNIRTP